MSQKRLPIDIYNYSDYRKFLFDLFIEWGKTVYKWSYARFSKEAGFAVSNYLKLVIDGKKNLGETGIEKIISYFQFNKSETLYFSNLVGFNQAKSDTLREKYFKKIKSSPDYRKHHKDDKDLHQFYSKWYNPVIRELVEVEGFQNDPKWVAKQLSPRITEAEAERSLKFLFASGQIIQTEDGKVAQSVPLMSTGEEVKAMSVAKYHKEMIRKASESLEKCSQAERDVSSLTMAVNPLVYEKLVKEIYAFQDRIIKLVTSEENSSPEDVCQLNFQLFPVTKVEKNTGDQNE